MSKNIKIIQNGNEKTLRKVEKIQTYLANGRTCNWVPEDEYPLGILTVTGDGVFNPADDPNGPYYGYSQVHASGVGSTDFGSLAVITITKNGEYIASGESDGPYYGYSRVVVNVEGGDSGGSPVVGKDDDGDDAVPKIDDDGHIVTEKLPTRISINVYPNNLVYEDGQAIDFTGLRVKAFLPNDTEWGVVDDNELIKPVTVANFGSSTPLDHRGRHVYSAGTVLGRIYTDSYDRTFTKINDGDAWFAWILVLGIYLNPVLVSLTRDGAKMHVEDVKSPGFTTDLSPNVTDTTNGVTHYGSSQYGLVNAQGASPITSVSSDYEALLYMINADSSGSEGQQTIPLQWKRPGDGKVLETSFTIAVHGSSGGE